MIDDNDFAAQVGARFGSQARQETRWRSPGDLAAALDASTVQTPALDLIDEALVDVDAGRCRRLIVSMPPQEGKSTRVTRFGALWLLLRDPSRTLGIVSSGADFASQLSYGVRRELQQHTGREGAIDLGLRVRSDLSAASDWKLEGHDGGAYAVGLGGQLTGRKVDTLILDDIVKGQAAADSEAQSEAAWRWWQTEARTRLSPGAAVIVVMTRWSENDLAGRLIAQQRGHEVAGSKHFDRWRVINVPAQADHRPERGEIDPLGRAVGEFMVSARGRNTEEWEATKASSSSRAWGALYQGRPSPDAGAVFLREWWQRFALLSRVTPADGGTVRCDGAAEVIQSWDLAFKDTKGSDFVVGQVWARVGADAFLLDQVRARMGFTDTVAAIKRVSAKWPQATAILIEDKANGPAVISALRSELSGLIPVSPGRDSKLSRAQAITPYVEAGNVHVPTEQSAGWAEGFVDELAAFPTGAHDDQVDAAVYAIARLLGRGRGQASAASPVGLQLSLQQQGLFRPGVASLGRGLVPSRSVPR